MPKKTYKEAHEEIWALLASRGWRLSDPALKVRHATSPSGEVRYWFKSQAIYVSRGMSHSLTDAHSAHVDARTLNF